MWNEQAIMGWMVGDTNQPVEMEVIVDGQVVGKIVANEHRADVGKALGTDGMCGFRFQFPAEIGALARRRARLRFAGSHLYIEPTVRSAAKIAEKTGPVVAPLPSPSTTANGFRSQFGGMWIDRADWMDSLGHRHRRGEISDTVAEQISRFVRDGYLVIPGAVPPETVDTLSAEIDSMWRDPPKGLFVSTTEGGNGKVRVVPPKLSYRDGKTKMLDVYVFSETARRAVANEPGMAFLRAIFEDTPKAFQGLSFWNGSEQEMHKDTAYVRVKENPMALIASWLALEDIEAGTGELNYYVGSHLAPDFLFGGKSKWMVSEEGNFTSEQPQFLASLHADARNYNFVKKSFLANKGDVLFWHADLAHGGSPVIQKGRTRKSLVTHFCPNALTPNYMNGSSTPAAKDGNCFFASAHSHTSLQALDTAAA